MGICSGVAVGCVCLHCVVLVVADTGLSTTLEMCFYVILSIMLEDESRLVGL